MFFLFQDASLLCGPTDIVRQIDNSKNGAELGVVVGKVIGTHVQASHFPTLVCWVNLTS
jgi:hypothetical protein